MRRLFGQGVRFVRDMTVERRSRLGANLTVVENNIGFLWRIVLSVTSDSRFEFHDFEDRDHVLIHFSGHSRRGG